MSPRNLPFLLLILAATTAWSQERKKLTNESGDKYSRTVETWYVLKTDPEVKDGPYKKAYNGKVILTGFYTHGQKDSVWEDYASNMFKRTLVTRKKYTQGKMTGKWEIFNWKGEPEYTYDFNNGVLTYPENHKADTTTFFYMTATGDWVRTSLDKNPIPLYGSGEWLSYLNRSFRYPDDAVNNEIQGTVIISMIVDEKGNASDYAVFKSVAPSLDQEALRVVSSFEHRFVPAEKDGKKVKSLYLRTVTFKLEKG